MSGLNLGSLFPFGSKSRSGNVIKNKNKIRAKRKSRNQMARNSRRANRR